MLSLCLALLLGACDSQNYYLPHFVTDMVAPSGQIATAQSSSGQSHMEPAQNPIPPDIGMAPEYNPKNMFGRPLSSDAERLDRLERAVQDMRNDFDSVRPSVDRLMAIEGDMELLIGELRRISDGAAANPPSPAAPVARATPSPAPAPQKAAPAKPKTYAKKSPPPVSGGKAAVYDVRVGEHPGKTRIVLDVNSKTNFNVDLDNSERLMVVDLPGAGWSAAMSKNFGGKSPLLSSYSVEPAGGGHMLIFQLKGTANIVSKSDIGANNGTGRRIVIDLTR